MNSPTPTPNDLDVVLSPLRAVNWSVIGAGALAGIVRSILHPVDVKLTKIQTTLFSGVVGALSANYIGSALIHHFAVEHLSGAISFATGLTSMNLMISIIRFGEEFNLTDFVKKHIQK